MSGPTDMSPGPNVQADAAPRERDLIAQARAAAGRAGESSVVEATLPLPRNFPGFDVVKEVHRGGQGVVYQAVQRATRRRVAIKVFHEGPFASARDRARFEREVDILAQLEHPNIVGIIDRGVTDTGSFYFVMDYVSGRTLDACLSETRSIDECLRLFVKVCDAVNAAHLKGVIHRDLKPSNIRVDADGEPHILDFGLAKIASSDVLESGDHRLMTMTGQFVGSLPWASPEQASGASGSVDVRTDVYSLGVVMYQMLTFGRFPYTVIGNMRDVLDNIMRAEPARPSTIRRQINDEVETIVLKALSKDRERRYQSAGDLARDIRRYLAGEPIEAKRDSGWYVLGKTISRHKTPVGAGAAIVVLIMVSAVGLGIAYRQAAAARDAARTEKAAAVAARDAEAEQRARAEQNFEAVRGLARTFIVEFNDDIRHLRGATAARHRILKEAGAYLSALRDQANERPEYLRELALAYERVGDIQGGLFLPRVGGASEADEAYAESRAIREALLRDAPGDPRALADLAESTRRLAWTMRRSRDHARALEEAARSVRQFDDALAATSGAQAELRRDIERARERARLDYADALRRASEEEPDPDKRASRLDASRAVYAQVREFWRQAILMDVADDDAARELGAATDDHARAELAVGLARRGQADRSADVTRALALLDEAHAAFERAWGVSDEALSEFSRLSAASPGSGALRRDVMLALHNRGEAKMRIAFVHEARARRNQEQRTALQQARAAHEEAARDFASALAIAEELASSDAANIEARRDLAVMLNKAGNQAGNTGDLELAIERLARSLEVRRDLYATDPTQMHRRDLAQGLVKQAQVLAAWAARVADDDPALPACARECETLAREGMSHLQALRDEGALAPDASEIRAADEAIATALNVAERLVQ